MKQVFSIGSFTGFFILLLSTPSLSLSLAANALLLWYQNVLPVLFPFMVISGMLIKTGAVRILSALLHPFLGPLFHISDNAPFSVLSGFLCGYPMGAKTIADLLEEGYITPEEGAYLLSFCNQTSPGFLIGFALMQHVKDARLVLPGIVCFFVSPILTSLLYRKYHLTSAANLSDQLPIASVPKGPSSSLFTMLDQTLHASIEAIVKVGGYMILFSLLTGWANLLPLPRIVKLCLLPLFEVTRGVQILSSAHLPLSYLFPAILGVVSFGGFCAAAQTNALVQRFHLPMKPYIIEKLVTASVTSLMAYCYMLFFY